MQVDGGSEFMAEFEDGCRALAAGRAVHPRLPAKRPSCAYIHIVRSPMLLQLIGYRTAAPKDSLWARHCPEVVIPHTPLTVGFCGP